MPRYSGAAEEPEDLAPAGLERDVGECHPISEALGQRSHRERRLVGWDVRAPRSSLRLGPGHGPMVPGTGTTR